MPGQTRSASGSRRRPSPVVVIYGVLGTLLAAYVVLLTAGAGIVDSTIVGGWGVDALELTAGVLCVARGFRSGRRSATAIVLGVALICWGIGDVIITIEELGGGTAPSPGPADALYITFFPLCYIALVLFVRGETRRVSSPSWFDGAIAGVGAGAVCAAFAFAKLEHLTGSSGLSVVVNLAYPVGDVLLLLLVAAGSAVMAGRRKGPWLLLAVGIIANVVGDTANLFQSALNSHAGVLADAVAWPISTFTMSLAMWLPRGTGDPLALRRPPGFALPALAAAAGLVVLFIGTLEPINAVATGLAAATLVLVVVRTLVSVRGLRALNRARYHESVTDELTGLANRRRLFDALDTVFSDDRPAAAFLFVDLDGFKQVNDAFGHPVGDEVLRRVGARLSDALGGEHLLARVGGDEFAVMIAGTDAERAAELARRLGAALDEPFAIDAVTARLTSSIGVAIAPTDAQDPATLFACADIAMYRAKLTGQRFALYERSLDAGSDRLELADELKAAIETEGLMLHYQPQLDLRSGELASVEALVRWNHPKLGVIPPLTFLPLAEEAGLMGAITHWVLDRALTQASGWRAAGTHVRMSVNVSAGDLVAPGFPEFVGRLLSDHGLPAAALVLELTETSILDEFERARAAVAGLQELGVQVSIDDFGAGFTSLAHLNGMSVDELKLDRQFIAPLAGGIRSRSSDLVRATIELGHAIGLRVVAEGVEDEPALALLADLGCDIVQGYGIGRPVPAAELRLVAAPSAPAMPAGEPIAA